VSGVTDLFESRLSTPGFREIVDRIRHHKEVIQSVDVDGGAGPSMRPDDRVGGNGERKRERW
jgi:hypothetical protein